MDFVKKWTSERLKLRKRKICHRPGTLCYGKTESSYTNQASYGEGTIPVAFKGN
uniref:Uncharacterized protein n=1 Tax=Triticum urartu TaxID=4572 RepID=A0A8R7TJX4_TRIUA